MLVVTTENVVGKKITNVLGYVAESTVRTKHLGKDICAAFKSLAGGEVLELTEMQNEARMIAVGRLKEKAEKMGANAIVGLRLTSSSIMNGASEMVAYGTAVYLEDIND